jgi:hypothetical protein
MFGRRRPVHEWSPSLIARQTVACFTSDPDQLEVRAATILHQDLKLLPKRVEKQAAEQRESGAEPEFQPFALACFGFTEDDRIGLYMEGDPTVLAKDGGLFATQEDAESRALAWVGDGAQRLPLANVPGVYQIAYMVSVTGDNSLGGSGEFMWALPAPDDAAIAMQPIREFPPKTGPTEMTPDPGQVSIFLLPTAVVEAMQREFGW